MARARLLKPGFFTNDKLGELPPVARLLFQGLWCIADKAGRVEDRPKRIKAEVLPYDRGDPDKMLGLLQEAGFIERYNVGCARYIQIVAFTKHQHPHPNEPASVIPASDNVTSASDNGGSTQAVIIAVAGSSVAESESLTDHPPNPPQAGGPRARAKRAANGSNRKRDIDALTAQEGSAAVYFRGPLGQRLKRQLDEQSKERAAAFKARPG